MSAYNRPFDLPSYERPPVSEVVLSVQFASNPQFQIVHAGLFWQLVRDQFPNVSEQIPLQAVFETFGGQVAPAGPIQVQAFSTPPFPRFWFESEDRAYVLQLQQDRILFNWRAISSDSVYPRYETLRERFLTRLRRLAEFFEREDRAQVRADMLDKTENILAVLDRAKVPDHMNLSGFRLHPLKGDLRGFWAVTVRANWRFTWRFEGTDALDVDLIDYH
jgi:toxin HigB-1